MPLLRAESLLHRRTPPGVLNGISLSIEAARFILLSGVPESGAPLLLRLLGLLERPDSGEVWFDSQPTSGLDDAARLELRNRHFGFLFAEPFLLDSFTVAENVAMPLFKIAGFDIEQTRARATEVLHFTGLTAAADLTVAGLSPLDYQKIALARALALAPRILIAEDAGLQLPAADLPDFAILLRSIPPVLGITVIATSPAAADLLKPDREYRLDRGLLAPAPQSAIQEAPAHD